MKQIFITATDTDAGKTFIGSALTHALVKQGQTVKVFKPVSAGCQQVKGQLQNDDAVSLQQFANGSQPLAEINPIAFIEPIAPHIAASKANAVLSNSLIQEHYNKIDRSNVDYLITEGAGGWRLPLGNGEFLSGFTKQNEMGVVLVVGMKLGCLNHAILTLEAIINDGLKVIGWVANSIDEMPYLEQNIQLLKEHFTAPLLGVIGHVNSIEKAAEQLDLSALN